MDAFSVTIPNVIILIAVLVISVYEVKAEKCTDLNGTNCTSCTERGDKCYWCPDTDECLKWKWGKYPKCKGNRSRYFYGQCDLNGVGFVIVFSVALFLLLVIIVSCCVCCCCYCMKRRKRRGYHVVPAESSERTAMRHRQFQARRNEIRHKYGLDTNDSTV